MLFACFRAGSLVMSKATVLDGIAGHSMNREHPRDPFHGITLARMLDELLAHYGWDELGRRVPIHCFKLNPSISSSLRFLRRTPWARAKVETLYLCYITAKEIEAEIGKSPVPRAESDETRCSSNGFHD
jgi:uncharacterized protein (DUF2132 family)